MDKNWVIARQPNAIPQVGKVYQIRDSRKGTFTGRILSVRGEWASVERLKGDIFWASKERNIFDGPRPDTVDIRAGLVYLIELEPETVLQVEADKALDAMYDEVKR